MLRERLEQDLIAALKSPKNAQTDIKISILRMLKAALVNAEIAQGKKGGFGDGEIEAVIRSEVKKLTDALVDFARAARADLVAKTKTELAVLEIYLPAAASAEKVRAAVSSAIVELKATGAKDFGRVMAVAMKTLAGRADGATVSAIVKEELAK